MEYEKCAVLKVEYRNTSFYGNNSYWLSFLDSSGRFERGYTSPNASCGYTAENYRYAEGKPIFLKYHYTGGGKCVIDSIMHNSPDKAEKYAAAMERQGGGIWREKRDF